MPYETYIKNEKTKNYYFIGSYEKEVTYFKENKFATFHNVYEKEMDVIE